MAIARRGMTGAAVRALSALGRFCATRYPQVIAGTIESPAPGRVIDAWVRDASWADPLLRLLPLERSVEFARADVTERLCLELEEQAARLCGKSFYVRARLRGLEGRLEARAVEQALGGFLVERCSHLGEAAQVGFDAPDQVVMIEVVEQRVGYGLLDRRVRELPLVRPR